MKGGEDFGKILSKYESIKSEFSSRNFDVYALFNQGIAFAKYHIRLNINFTISFSLMRVALSISPLI